MQVPAEMSISLTARELYTGSTSDHNAGGDGRGAEEAVELDASWQY